MQYGEPPQATPTSAMGSGRSYVLLPLSQMWRPWSQSGLCHRLSRLPVMTQTIKEDSKSHSCSRTTKAVGWMPIETKLRVGEDMQLPPGKPLGISSAAYLCRGQIALG